jgi:23S rRNA (cytidine1920-2'-O)/16S rRNA (cytidine1409-2'-O)-methyltransferase
MSVTFAADPLMKEKAERQRLDVLMVAKGLASSRQRARALIMAGRVRVDGARVEKPGREVSHDVELSVQEDLPFVSRGGFKLDAALKGFGLDPTGLRILDVGASTGGFTDCLLQHGAAHVVAVDVGYGQLHWKLRSDSRVTALERRNVRFLPKESLPGPVHGLVADMSFISLTLVLPRFAEFVEPGGWVLVLVKPQFEVGRMDVGKGGVVRDPEKMRCAIETVKAAAKSSGFEVLGELESPITGPKGNREFFLYLRPTSLRK